MALLTGPMLTQQVSSGTRTWTSSPCPNASSTRCWRASEVPLTPGLGQRL